MSDITFSHGTTITSEWLNSVHANSYRRYSIFSKLTLAERLDVVNRTHQYDLSTKVQELIDEVYAAGGGIIHFPKGDYYCSAEIWLKQYVVLEGDFAGFAEPYSHPYPRPEGTAFFKPAGSNTNGIKIQCDLTLDSGVLYDTGTTKRNTGARHCGGIRDITFYGNRSLNPLPTSKDLNSTGDGIVCQAARNFVLERVTSIMWAGTGITTSSYNFGTGLLGVNILHASYITVMCNSVDGIYLSIGDSTLYYINAGYNGRNGITATLGNSAISCGRTWNNFQHGAYFGPIPSSGISQAIGLFSYDNDAVGITVVGGPRNTQLIGCTSRGNGRNSQGTYTTDTNKVNYYIDASTPHWSVVGCSAGGYDQASVLTATYNYYIANWTYSGVFTGNSSDSAAVVADTYIADYSHLNTSTVPSSGDTRGIWATISSITSNTIAITSISQITLNVSGGGTINTMTYSGQGFPRITLRNAGTSSITITHNPSSIRCNSGASITLAQYQAVEFIMVASNVWQQV